MSEQLYQPAYDTLMVEAREALSDRFRVDRQVRVNGEIRERHNFPQLRGLMKAKTLLKADVSHLRLRSGRCSLCASPYTSDSSVVEDPKFDELPFYRAATSLQFCDNCRHWEFYELRSETHDARADLFTRHIISITSSKVREFEVSAPQGSMAELSQWFRQHPSLYNSVSPRYLETLVARVFLESGQYCEVTHVGRPDDGGVDVILVEGDGVAWLVQVKRRESANAVESVGTIRSLLGSLILENADRGIVVSTADHFSLRAQQAVSRVTAKGIIVRLVDRKALDALLAGALPESPWRTVLSSLSEDRWEWFGWSPNLPLGPTSAINPDQLTLFDAGSAWPFCRKGRRVSPATHN